MSSEDLKKANSGGHEVGMSLALTTIFIAGQMAGGGVLMLPGIRFLRKKGLKLNWSIHEYNNSKVLW